MAKIKVTQEQYTQIMDEMVIDFLKTASIEERHQLVFQWNYRSQGGRNIFKWIANDPNTDKATALMLYWKQYLSPWHMKIYASRDEVHWADVDDFDFHEELEHLYLSGFYKNHAFAFDPTSNDGKNGWNWTVKPSFNTKREIPAMMFEKLMGKEIPCNRNFSEGALLYIWEKLREYETVD